MDKDNNNTEVSNGSVENIEGLLNILFSGISARGKVNYREMFIEMMNDSLALNPKKSYNTVKGWFVSDSLPNYLTKEQQISIAEILCFVNTEMVKDNLKENEEIEKTLKIAEKWIKRI